MSQTPITVTYTIEEVLARIENKIDTLQKDVTDLKVGQSALSEKVEGIDNRLKSLEGTQKNQVWTLITLLGGSLIAVGFRALLAWGNP